MGPCFLQAPLVHQQLAELTEHGALAASVAHRTMDRQRLLVAGAGRLDPALLEFERTEKPEDGTFGAPVAHFARDRQRRAVVAARLVRTGFAPVEAGEIAQGDAFL